MALAWLLLAALARNVIPAYGVLVLGWAPGTLVVLFVIDVVLAVAATSLRIRAHHVATGNQLHRDPTAYAALPGIAMRTLRGVFWRDYFEFAFSRAVILGIMAYAFPMIISLKFPEQRAWLVPDWSALALGATGVLAVHVLARIGESGRISRVPFPNLIAAARAAYAQVLLLTALVMGGCFAILFYEDIRAIGFLLLGLKLVADLFEAWLAHRRSNVKGLLKEPA